MELSVQIERYLEQYRDEIVENVCKLVQIPSLACQDDSGKPYGEACAKALDFCSELAQSKNLHTRNYDYRCIEATLNQEPKGKRLVLASHADIVPVDEDDMIYPPFGGQIVGDYIVGRGVVDDKGPLIATLYALAFFAENKIPLKNDIRLVFGSNEEMGMDDISYYLEQAGQPDLGLSVDDDFPTVNGEKGLLRFTLSAPKAEILDEVQTWGPKQRLIHNHAKLSVSGREEELLCAPTELLEHSLLACSKAQELVCELAQDSKGDKMNIHYQDEQSGETLVRLYGIDTVGEQVRFYFDVRLPVSICCDTVAEQLKGFFAETEFAFEVIKNSAGYYVPEDDPELKMLTDLYNRVTDAQDRPYVMGACTYARAFARGFGFGAGNPHEKKPFPQGHGAAHGADEAHNIPVLLHAIRMYILGIYELDQMWGDPE